MRRCQTKHGMKWQAELFVRGDACMMCSVKTGFLSAAMMLTIVGLCSCFNSHFSDTIGSDCMPLRMAVFDV